MSSTMSCIRSLCPSILWLHRSFVSMEMASSPCSSVVHSHRGRRLPNTASTSASFHSHRRLRSSLDFKGCYSIRLTVAATRREKLFAGTAKLGSAKRIVSNAYFGNRGIGSDGGRIYKRIESCLVIPPPKGKQPRAIIKFLGGAFIGAIPEVTYSYLLELLAKEGFLVISVPYNVTFDHSEASRQVYERFHACLDSILSFGLPHANLTSSQLDNLPFFCVGHSNGALLQVLTGSYFAEKIPMANAIISYNNRPVTEAVPYFEQLGPLVSQIMPVVETSPVYSMARNASGDVWKTLLGAAGAIMPNNDQEPLVSLTKFVDQLPSVLNQVTQGISEFKPTPSENLLFFKTSYNVQHNLLVKFNSDAIDETAILEKTLTPRIEIIGGTIEKVQLNGNHITPCIQEPKWETGAFYTPADAIAQGLKTFSLNETKALSKAISNWFRRYED